jgi:multidrug efflux pump subunit AcrA (membrane-fusion protein)
MAMVFTDTAGVARMRVVQTGEETGGRTIIAAGLSDGDRVIVNPPGDLLDGRPVVASATAPGRPR